VFLYVTQNKYLDQLKTAKALTTVY
jgi:hypothetical protein